MRFTASQMDELFGHPKPTLEDRRYDLRRDYETWFSDKNKVPDCDSWLIKNLIERQKDYFKALASCEDEKKEMPTTYNLYQKKDLLEWWNYKLCEEFDAIANTWLLALDAYIAQLAIEYELQSSS